MKTSKRALVASVLITQNNAQAKHLGLGKMAGGPVFPESASSGNTVALGSEEIPHQIRIEQLRAQIEEGTYQITGQALAHKMLAALPLRRLLTKEISADR